MLFAMAVLLMVVIMLKVLGMTELHTPPHHTYINHKQHLESHTLQRTTVASLQLEYMLTWEC
jgi:hypothetical protein